MLYVGRTYTARLSGSVMKGVCCENCGCDYLYKLSRVAEGKGSSPYYLDNSGAAARAESAAQRALSRALKGFDLAPCPSCGAYQSEMIKKMKGAYTWILVLAVIVGIVAGLSMLGGVSAFMMYSTALAGFSLALWYVLNANCQPNLRAAERVGQRVPGAPPIISCAALPQMFANGDLDEDTKKVMIAAMEMLDARKQSKPQKSPMPMDPVEQESAEVERRGTFRLRMIVLFAGAIAIFWAIGPVSNWVYEERAYTTMINSPKADPGAGIRFIAAFPTSSHVLEAEELTDDRTFTQALSVAKSQNSNFPLQQYLSNKYARKHRDEAKAAALTIYTDALKRLQALTEKGKADANLSRGLFALLNSLADAERPTVTVAFNPTYDALPQDLLAIQSENESLKQLKSESTDVAVFLQTIPNPILEPGKVFDADQMLRRENLILERLRSTIYKGCGTQVVNFALVSARGRAADAAAKPAEQAMMQINYHIYPLGAVSVWTENVTPWNPAAGRAKTPAKGANEKIRGVVRHYNVDWDIVIRPKGNAEAYTLKLESHSQPNFQFKTNPGDPNWALYSILLQSAAYDFSNELIRKFGMEPPPLPTFYTADGAAN